MRGDWRADAAAYAYGARGVVLVVALSARRRCAEILARLSRV